MAGVVRDEEAKARPEAEVARRRPSVFARPRGRAVAAEEMTKKDTAKIVRELSAKKEVSDGAYDDSGRMSDAQYNFIDVKCRQLNINGEALFKTVFNVDNKRKISKKVGSDIIDSLNEYQRDKTTIPEPILGYIEEWRN